MDKNEESEVKQMLADEKNTGGAHDVSLDLCVALPHVYCSRGVNP